MAVIVGLAFVVGTLLSWTLLQLIMIRSRSVDRRLRMHSGQPTPYTKPLSIDEEGDAITDSARHTRSKITKRQKPRTPLQRLMYARVQHKRQEEFTKQIIDALALIASSLRAGYSFIQSMEMVAREMQPPLGEEFALAVHEMSLGATVEESLEAMADRVELEELSLVVTAVLVQRQVGGNLAEVLETIAYTIRERIRIRGEIRALTAQGRISGWVVGLLPLALVLIISAINPSYMATLFNHPIGWVLLAFGLSGQLVGMLIIRKIIAIEV